MKYFKYKGYLGTIEPDFDNGSLFGKLAFIRDLVTYEADTLPDLEKEFQLSVDEYLLSCEELGHTPQVPCQGVFNVRISPELHQSAVLASGEMSLNAFVSEAIQEKVTRCFA